MAKDLTEMNATELEAEYNSIVEERDGLTQKLREVKREWNKHLEIERTSAILGIDVTLLSQEERQLLLSLASKLAAPNGPNDAVAQVNLVTQDAEANN